MTWLCECGCGAPTKLARRTNARYGHVVGRPVRFIPGHHTRRPEGYASAYRSVRVRKVNMGAHQAVAERALGKPLPPGAQIHVNGDGRAATAIGGTIRARCAPFRDSASRHHECQLAYQRAYRLRRKLAGN